MPFSNVQAGFVVAKPAGLLTAELLSSLAVSTRLGGAQVETTQGDTTALNVTALGTIALSGQDAFLVSFTESLMTFALGRRMEPSDMPVVRRVIRDAAATDYRLSSFILGVVNSAPFRMTQSAVTETASRP